MSKKLFFLLMIAAVLSFAGFMLGQGQGRGGRDDQLNLPDGPGKDILQSACTECHNLQMAVGTGYNREEWGLTAHELSLCQRTAVIPTWPEFPTMNLAQSVGVFCSCLSDVRRRYFAL